MFKIDNKILRTTVLENLLATRPNDLLWLDLNDSTQEERQEVENKFDLNLSVIEESTQMEASSRFVEAGEYIVVNTNFLVYKNEQHFNHPVSFVLKDKVLISFRDSQLKSFTEVMHRIRANPRAFPTGFHILVSLFEIRIDFDADWLENIAKEIARLGKTLTVERNLDEQVIIDITLFQENTMNLRENIIDKQRVVSAMLRSERFPRDCVERLRILIKDINSLIDHTAFNFERLEYLQNTFLGLINIEQNKIVKIFTVVSVVFMPPTLIASIYGMNFKTMPELEWPFGYGFALCLMVMSSLFTLLFFKKKKWL